MATKKQQDTTKKTTKTKSTKKKSVDVDNVIVAEVQEQPKEENAEIIEQVVETVEEQSVQIEEKKEEEQSIQEKVEKTQTHDVKKQNIEGDVPLKQAYPKKSRFGTVKNKKRPLLRFGYWNGSKID